MLDALAEFGGCCLLLHTGSFRCIRKAESKDFNGFVLIFSVSRTNARARTLPAPRRRREFPVSREFRGLIVPRHGRSRPRGVEFMPPPGQGSSN
jgi:hypothetical protein